MSTLFAVALPTLLLAIGAGADYARYSSQLSAVVGAADAGALAGARQFSLNATPAVVQQAAAATTKAELTRTGGASDPINVSIDSSAGKVTVTVTHTVQTRLLKQMGLLNAQIVKSATAKQAAGRQMRICLLALDPAASSAFTALGQSTVNAPTCALQSNSTSPTGITSSTQGTITMSKICSGGGSSGNGMTPAPASDCPPIPDPLASYPPPVEASKTQCDYNGMTISAGSVTLFPGIYCGGLTVRTTGIVTFNPGVYVIRNGPFLATQSAQLRGVGVGFYLQGASELQLNPNSSIDFSAPESGSMAGLIFREDSSSPPLQKHFIKSFNAQSLLGTLYFPNGSLFMGGAAKIGGAAAYTIIVARQIALA